MSDQLGRCFREAVWKPDLLDFSEAALAIWEEFPVRQVVVVGYGWLGDVEDQEGEDYYEACAVFSLGAVDQNRERRVSSTRYEGAQGASDFWLGVVERVQAQAEETARRHYLSA